MPSGARLLFKSGAFVPVEANRKAELITSAGGPRDRRLAEQRSSAMLIRPTETAADKFHVVCKTRSFTRPLGSYSSTGGLGYKLHSKCSKCKYRTVVSTASSASYRLPGHAGAPVTHAAERVPPLEMRE